MPAIKVRATKNGWYGGRFIGKGREFFLTDQKDALGKIKLRKGDNKPLTAEAAFADAEASEWGWMVRVQSKQEELVRAQAQSDLLNQAVIQTAFSDHANLDQTGQNQLPARGMNFDAGAGGQPAEAI